MQGRSLKLLHGTTLIIRRTRHLKKVLYREQGGVLIAHRLGSGCQRFRTEAFTNAHPSLRNEISMTRFVIAYKYNTAILAH